VAENKSNLANYNTDYLMENREELASDPHMFVSSAKE